VIQQLTKVKDSYNCDALSIAGAVAALADQQWLAENRRQIVATRGRLMDALRRLGFTVPDSWANFVWCTRDDRPMETLYQQLKERQILVRYMSYPGWPPGLRISVGTDQQMDVLLRNLEQLLSGAGPGGTER
jgi:histidinol-phosphate aminotransferase